MATTSSPRSGKYRLLWQLIAPQRRRYAAALAAILLANVAIFGVPMISAVAIDHVIRGQKLSAPAPVVSAVEYIGGHSVLAHNLWICSLAILVLTAISGAVSYLKDRWVAKASESITRQLRDRLYNHLQNLPCTYYDKAQTGDLVQRCTSDVETVKGFLSMQVLEIIRISIMLLAMLPFMISLSGRMTLLGMSMMPIVLLFSLVFFAKVRKAFRHTDEAEGAMTSVLQENLTGIRVVRAFARHEFECGKFADKNATLRDSSSRLLRLLAWYWASSDMVCHAQNVLLLVCGAYWVTQGSVSVGVLAAFLAYENMVLWPMRQMGRILTELGKATVSIERLQDILESPAEAVGSNSKLPVAPAAPRGGICVRNLSFGFEPAPESTGTGTDAKSQPGQAAEANGTGTANDNCKGVLHDVSFDLPAGQTLAILGGSGSGKSTLIHLLLRFYDYPEGSIQIDGRELRDIDRREARAMMAVVLQEPFLYSRSLRDNIRLGHERAAHEDLEQAAQAACIHESIVAFDKGYDTVVGERGVTLSGGQRQRVAIARALLREAPFLLLDDSLSAVDTQTEMLILSALRKRRGKATTILIAHRLSALRQADQILVLEHGRVAQRGTHEELIAQEGLYASLWRIQSSLEEDLDAEMATRSEPPVQATTTV